MKLLQRLAPLFLLMVLAGLLASCAAQPLVVTPAASATGADPLFINMTTDDPHRANMALSFGMKQLDLGHPLTVFLNDKGVYVGATANADKFAEQQQTIAALLEKGAVVYSCPMCMQHYGVNEADLLPGILVSNPDAIGKALFQPNTRTLTW
jgi:sulfur relay (sulfurtransferase) complex TusBCD TusD component (DsrE family)